MKKFWNFKNDNNGKAELMLYGDISEYSWWGDEVTPKEFKKEMDALGEIDQLDIFINSGGGDVFAGESIYNMLNRHKAHKIVHIDGLAASIASVIAMAGDEVVMPENAMMMIHEAWTYASGNKSELRSMADNLERIDGALRGIYTARTGKNEEEITAMMEAETWMTAADAVANGFADRIEENKKIAASANKKTLIMNGVQFDLTRYANAPEMTPCNGAETQPVEENKPKNTGSESAGLKEQRERFNKTREKIMKTYEKENEK